MPTIQELIEWLQKTYPDRNAPCAYHLWLAEDVKDRALEKGYIVTDKQAAEILETMHHRCDSNIGLNWDVLDCYIEDVNDEQGLTKATCKDLKEADKCDNECELCNVQEKPLTVCPHGKPITEECPKCIETDAIMGADAAEAKAMQQSQDALENDED